MSTTALPLARDSFSGMRVGRYEVLCRLAVGGTSEIFLAFQRGLAGFQKLVVIKRLLPEVSEQPELMQLFLDEARITAKFTHPNIVQVFDLDQDGGGLFLAMEFMGGASLAEVVGACLATSQPLPLGLTLAAIRETALALQYAHTRADAIGRAKQVIHRDVTPRNIMLTYEGTTKLLDFGIAKTAGRATRTSAGRVRGSSGYMSPEQMCDEPLDPRTDLFSLAVVAHECLTGQPLYDAPSLAEVMRKVGFEAPPRPSALNRRVSAELDAVVLKGLAREREERHATALDFARELERVAGPLIWQPEQIGGFVRRLFPERYEQTLTLVGDDDDPSGISGRFERLLKAASPKPQKPTRVSGAGPAVSARPMVGVGEAVATEMHRKPALGGTGASPPTELLPARTAQQVNGRDLPGSERGPRSTVQLSAFEAPALQPPNDSFFSLANPFLAPPGSVIEGTGLRPAPGLEPGPPPGTPGPAEMDDDFAQETVLELDRSAPPGPQPAQPAAGPPRPRRRWLLVAAAVVMALLVGLAAAAYRERTSKAAVADPGLPAAEAGH